MHSLCKNLVTSESALFNGRDPRVHYSGSHWTMDSSTQVNRRLCLMRMGLARAIMWCMVALSFGASLPLRGSTVVEVFRVCFAQEFSARVVPLAWKVSAMCGSRAEFVCGEGRLA